MLCFCYITSCAVTMMKISSISFFSPFLSCTISFPTHHVEHLLWTKVSRPFCYAVSCIYHTPTLFVSIWMLLRLQIPVRPLNSFDFLLAFIGICLWKVLFSNMNSKTFCYCIPIWIWCRSDFIHTLCKILYNCKT